VHTFFSLLRQRQPGPSALSGLVLLALLFPAATGGALGADSQIMPLAVKSLLLDGQVVGDRIVVVGERGHILISEDQGVSWQQQLVPTRTTLTSVFFIDPANGWAAGHDGVILKTGDGGRHWQQVYSDPQKEEAILDLWFKDREHGYAVGAYGLFLATENGGSNWEPLDFDPVPLDGGGSRADSADEGRTAEEPWGIDFHLNQIIATADGRIFIAAEAGNLYRSDDGGRSWLALPSPYDGSFYGTLPLSRDAILAFGLRGHLFRTDDAGRTWTAVETGTQATLNDGILLADGRIVLAGLAGALLFSEDSGRSFQSHSLEDRAGISKVVQTADGALVLIGDHGVRRLAPPAPGEGARQ
jgi:photosystem II stability/assembly factor-like uncharacterized protein